MEQTIIAIPGGRTENDGSPQPAPGRQRRRRHTTALLGPAVAVLLAGGCRDIPAAPQGQPTVAPRLKASTGETINVPRLPPPPPATVAIVKYDTVNDDSYSSMVSQALAAALGPGGISNLVSPGKTVLIKPNLVWSVTKAVTSWKLVKALVDQIKAVNGGANITIADGSATQDVLALMAQQGYTSANFGSGVTFANFNDDTTNPTDTYVLEDTRTGQNKQIPNLVRLADVYIDMPKMKTHGHAGYTGALKNLGIGTGPLPLWDSPGEIAKSVLHHDIRSEIVDHVACRVPDLIIMDAIQAMEGEGPISGDEVTMNMVLASKDPVALDTVSATIMGIPPALITHLVLAANENLGVMDLDDISVTGNITLADASALHTFVRATAAAPQSALELGVIPYRATTVLRPTPGAMTIDGDLAEWGYANAMTVDTSAQVKGSGAGWGGAADSSIIALGMYDSQDLYLALHVWDDTKLTNGNTGSSIVNGDSVELYLSTYPEQYETPRTGAAYGSSSDYRLAISYADTPNAYLLSHNRSLTGATIRKVDTSDGYVLEAKIPWSNFGSPSMAPTALSGGYVEYRQLGLNVAVNDADSNPSTVEHKLVWNNAKESDLESNPIKIGMSYVDPAGGLYASPTYTLAASGTNGTVTKTPDTASYNANRVVSLTAVPSTGYEFTGWSGDATGTANPVSVTMNGNKNIVALFQAEPPILTSITVAPATASVTIGGTQQFSAIAYDQRGAPLSPQPPFTWSVAGGGTIDTDGHFTAGSTASGPHAVTAQSGTVSGTASVTVTEVLGTGGAGGSVGGTGGAGPPGTGGAGGAQDAAPDVPGTGGTGTGGMIGTGGMTGTGGLPGLGGIFGTGGTADSGIGFDGETSTGGTITIDAPSGNGGAMSGGGATASGGMIATGGTIATGGVVGSGGTLGLDGAAGIDGPVRDTSLGIRDGSAGSIGAPSDAALDTGRLTTTGKAEDGCSCVVGASPGSMSAALAMVLLVLAPRRRRRRAQL